MPSLDPTLRKLLENKIPDARIIAEEASRAILNTLAVNRPEPYPVMTAVQRQLRNALRAKARQFGEGSQTEGFELLVEELAYQQWHRMVFARFLAENQLLMHPSGVPVTLQECSELAREEGEMDAWAVAAKYAALMLPGIFRQDDPESQVRFAPEGQQKLEVALNSIASPIFLADDALGWMYQFWQKNKKDEVNNSGRKIGGADLSPVTQLFTEDYMVRFLLENSLGAWWAVRHPNSPLIKDWQYLRRKEDGSPAAGTFPGWPEKAAQVTLMDPCCGSGHFLVAGFEMLSQMRIEEECLTITEAGDVVLRDNLFGLEIDLRCTQIASFALALTAWRTGGYHSLPVPNVACSGIPVQGQLETWLNLAGEDVRVRAGLERLYGLFKNAPDLGSLINPTELPAADRMFVADYEQVAPVLEQALAKEQNATDPVSEIFGAAAENVAKATRLLAEKYTLVITNVPYLMQGKQKEVIRKFCKENYLEASKDLATTFVTRCLDFSLDFGTTALVTPHNWRFLQTYEQLRRKLLLSTTWNIVVNLGAKAFITPMWDFNIGFSVISKNISDKNHKILGLDVSSSKSPKDKIDSLINQELVFISQKSQLLNPETRIILAETEISSTLKDYADTAGGMCTFDSSRFLFDFWELPLIEDGWLLSQTTVKYSELYGGRSNIIRWENGEGQLYTLVLDMKRKGYTSGIWKAGQQVWKQKGVLVALMGNLQCTLYTGEPFDNNTGVLIPKDINHLPAIWAFCSSDKFNDAVRKIDPALKVTNGSLSKVPFDLDHWQKVAEQAGPLPEPHSEDPTQWLFNGHPVDSKEPLQVAVARLLGYQWPQQHPDVLDEVKDEDGILCLPSVIGEAPAAEVLRTFLAKAFGKDWSPVKQAELLAQVGSQGKTLEDWLRDDFFAQHCRLFQNRPFIWHIWDGRKDGFSALVNYHKLTTANLDRLIYTYLGDWINFQRGRRDHGEPGADGRLVAALQLQEKLKLIRVGEPPYDICVRWKSLAQEPIGWDPDVNDGVRLNIRPFVTAGLLRSKFTINWNKDRGTNPDGSERLNDLHFTMAEKQAAGK